MGWKTVVVTVVVLVGAAYLLGFWPEYQRRLAAERDLAGVQQQVDAAQARVSAARLLGELLNVVDAVAALNYGQARTYSSRFFDDVQATLSQPLTPDVRTVLESVLKERDNVTAALARADGSVSGTLRAVEIQLRRALGYEVPDVVPASPSATAG